MPNQLCGKCGGSLVASFFCAECKSSIQKMCSKCGLKIVEHFHLCACDLD